MEASPSSTAEVQRTVVASSSARCGEAGANGLALVDRALEWKAQFIEKGWA
jgi:hypothetical protein